METKTCPKCNETKPLAAFSLHKRGLYGHRSRCRTCASESAKAWREANLEQAREATRKWQAANPEKALAARASWTAANAEKVLATRRARYAVNPENSRAANAAGREGLSLSYVASTLRIPAAQVTPELFALKREQLEIHRLKRAMTKALKEHEDESCTDSR